MEYFKYTLFCGNDIGQVDEIERLITDLGVSGYETINAREFAEFIQNNDKYWDYVDENLLSPDDNDTKILFYIEADYDYFAFDERFTRGLRALDLTPRVVKERVDDSEWLDVWRQYYKPFRIGKSVVVRPAWEDYDAKPGDVVLTIEPGSVFGTGLHQSTRMCVQTLEDVIKPGDFIADFGTGSGILAITAMLLGAGRVMATEIEEQAAVIVRKNAELNGISDIELFIGDILQEDGIKNAFGAYAGMFDHICANIVADVIIKLAPIAHSLLKRGGVFITSGIIKERKNDVLNAICPLGFTVFKTLGEDEWASISFVKG